MGTPFTIPSLSDQIDPAASQALDNDLLQHIKSVESSLPKIKAMMRHLLNNMHPTLPMTLSTDKIQLAYKSWNQDTTTSPAGCHLDHYHTLLPIDDEDVDCLPFWNLHTTILSGLTNT